ncbi:zf-HC2 domain-containing protein [Streptomyces sp. Je 1-79]|uniref:zf-HC2 domain-containing protein n=1 Tax=Streptomyces sp. Je 1-79 TaxID=2943847 RepID=UPI0021A812B4|nr:zf-HC2 domain-containing protein [Streptomyces sp. Je 1-79]MCT4354900.1 zf-HC2 domain-containing protein [Streptomyces sp. Je 1-79]
MTSTTGRADTAQHPDVSEISDLTEGLLSPSRTAAVRRHIEGCSLCADVRTSLEEIRGLLGTLPGPPRMPADIAGRIDAALAAEALLSATTPDIATPVSRETTSGRPDAPSSTAPAPAPDRPAGRAQAATGPGRSKPRRRRTAALGAIFGAAALGMTLFLTQGGMQTLTGGESADTKTGTAASGVAAEQFDGRPVETQVQELLQGDSLRVPKATQPESLNAEGGNTPKRGTAETLPECVKAGTGRTDAVLAFDRGEYQGTPAYLLVLPSDGDSAQVQAYVLDASCAETAGQAKAEVLLTQTYPRS